MPTSGNDTINAETTATHWLTGGGGSDTFLMTKKSFGPSSDHIPVWGTYDVIADFQGAGGWNPTNNDTIAITGFDASATLHLKGNDDTKAPGSIFEYYVEEFGQKYWFSVISTNGHSLDLTQDVFLWHP